MASFSVECGRPATVNSITGVSVPAGTYYSGQVVPVTLTLSSPAVLADGTTLSVNGVECPLLNNAGTESKQFTFGYTVRGIDTGAVNVTALNGTLLNKYGEEVTLEANLTETSFGVDQGVRLVSTHVKDSSLDLENVKYGIDDAIPGSQSVTVVIPFKEGAAMDWITSDAVELTPAPLSLTLPDYGDTSAFYYLKSAYVSTDNGVTRYPVYVVGEDADALAVRYTTSENTYTALRRESARLFLDPNAGTAQNYLGAWEDGKTDSNGYIYFDGFDESSATAPISAGASWTYYVKGCNVNFDPAAYTSRGSDTYAVDEFGFIPVDGSYVVAQDAEHPENRYDVEIVANQLYFNAVSNGARVESPTKMALRYQISNRDDFSFTEPRFFTWSSSDESVAWIVKNEETGVGEIFLTGQQGTVSFTLTVGNGTGTSYTLTTPAFTVLEGKTPFLNIPALSQIRTTLTGEDTDLLFASNLTARNAAAAQATTAFTAKLYKVSELNAEPTGDPIWTQDFNSTLENTHSRLTVPGSELSEYGVYAVVISARYAGGLVDGVDTDPIDFSATAWLNVKQKPISIKLNALESYSVAYGQVPAIGYALENAAAGAVVEYTVQKSGEAMSERTSVSGGTIPFAASKPEGLKDSYAITVYAKNPGSETWSLDSMLLKVYNMDLIDLIVKDVAAGDIGGTTGGTGDGVKGQTITLDNHSKLAGYGITGDNYQLSYDDLTELRTDLSLQKIISANYGTGAWGLLADKMEWSSDDSSSVSVNYKQGGIYSDLNNYSYTSYAPTTDFLLVGKDDATNVTVTATHAATGMQASVNVNVNTLTDQLYVFQFMPKAETDVTYTNGDDQKRTLKSNENGELVVYEPQGIKSAVMAMSEVDGETYVGTIYKSELNSGERDIASLQLYPCNNLRLRSISKATLTFKNPDGSAYSGPVTLRGGVYKNGIYCPGAEIFLEGELDGRDGKADIEVTVVDGKLDLRFNPMQFKNDPSNTNESGALPGDNITYVFEYRVAGCQVSYATLHAYTDLEGEQDPTESVIQLKNAVGPADTPQIISQTMTRYYDGQVARSNVDVSNCTESIGISKRFNQAELRTDYMLPESFMNDDGHGNKTLSGEFALYTINGQKLTGQRGNQNGGADMVTSLSVKDSSPLYLFPFSYAAYGCNFYTINDENLSADGVTGEGENAVYSTAVKAMFARDGATLMSVTLPFCVENLSKTPDLMEPDSGLPETVQGTKNGLEGEMNVGDAFKKVKVNSMIKSGFTFLGGMECTNDNVPFNVMILPTENPGIFRIIIFIGYNQPENDDDGLHMDYNPQAVYDDISGLIEGDDDPFSMDFRFSGTLILDAGFNFNSFKWQINFRGGSVGLGFSVGFNWTQNFFIGPVPVTISFGIGADLDVTVTFVSKSTAKAMLLDTTIGITINAFVGVGFDYSIAKLKLGIFGTIGAEANVLYLRDLKNKKNYNGTELRVKGEIGIRLEIKIVFVKYKKTFCSTSFSLKADYNQYVKIQQQWEQFGYADLLGETENGRSYAMRLYPNGTAMMEIDGDGEIENRDYLEMADRIWNDGTSSEKGLKKAAPMVNAMNEAVSDVLNDVQTNAYPNSDPVLTDDGALFLYISDNDNAEAPESVVSYAVKNGNSYTNMGAVDTSEDNILADSSVVASGTGSSAFAAWVKQVESPEKEMHDTATTDDLGMMMNATEVYAGAYNGSAWTVERLTTNMVADMAPAVASSGDKAIVAWRSLSATQMPADADDDLTAMFNAENNINYRIYNNGAWTDAQIAYNGSAGTVNAIDAAMLSDGTALLVYTVRTDSADLTSTETFYTLIGTDGSVETTGRLTNDNNIDTNAQVVAVGDQFVAGWYSEYDAAVEDDVKAQDIRLARINKGGSVDSAFPESIGGELSVNSDFRFSQPYGNDDLDKLSILWSQPKESEDNTVTVTWKNANGDILEVDAGLTPGSAPSYDGATPTKAADGNTVYFFAGWTPAVTAANSNATYTATYKAYKTNLTISPGQYIRLGKYQNSKNVDWYCQRINSTGTMMLCKYSFSNNSQFVFSTDSYAVYGNGIYRFLDRQFGDQLYLNTAAESLVRTVDLSASGGDGTDRFIAPSIGNEELTPGEVVTAPYNIGTTNRVYQYWLRDIKAEMDPSQGKWSPDVYYINHSNQVTVTVAEWSTSGQNSKAVRPMFYLDTEAIKNLYFTGSGTEGDPYVIATHPTAASATVNVTATPAEVDNDVTGKYEIRAVRFYEEGDAIGVSTSANIADTDKNVTIDHLDSYTDASGNVYALVLSSDYSSVEGINYYDTIDLGEVGLEAQTDDGEANEEHLTILEQDPVCGIKLGHGAFKASAIKVQPEANLKELAPGLDLPVQFAVKNTGTNTIHTVTVEIGSNRKTFEGLTLLPGQSTTLVIDYSVPETVKDGYYCVTVNGGGRDRHSGGERQRRP